MKAQRTNVVSTIKVQFLIHGSSMYREPYNFAS